MQSTEAEILRNEETDKEPRYTHIRQKCVWDGGEKFGKSFSADT